MLHSADIFVKLVLCPAFSSLFQYCFLEPQMLFLFCKQRRCCGRMMGHTDTVRLSDRQTDARPFHKPCSAYCGQFQKRTLCFASLAGKKSLTTPQLLSIFHTRYSMCHLPQTDHGVRNWQKSIAMKFDSIYHYLLTNSTDYADCYKTGHECTLNYSIWRNFSINVRSKCQGIWHNNCQRQVVTMRISR